MPKLARVGANDSAPEEQRAPRRRIRRVRRRRMRHRYYAFLSYSHKDEALAEWLHAELERFRVPRALAGKLTANGAIPKRLSPIFRDEQELAAADDLTTEIEAALASSQFLIVLCSPSAAASRWTNAEIETFKRNHPEGCVLAAIASGEPFASEIPGREAEECFPPALRYKFDRRGRLTKKRAEPLAADLRDEGDGRRMGVLKLIAGMLGVGLDELVQRDTARRNRRFGYLVAASIAGMAVTSTLALTAIQARDAARDQRREAEGLVAFMLGDLKDKLEPIGRLDALDGVGSRVLAYYSKQDTSELSDASLLQRSRALSLMGEVATLRGDMDGALRLYAEASAGTAEAVRRKPEDPQRLFDHAQNVFYVGEIAHQRGHLDRAEAAMREYKRLADRMVAIDSNNLKWRMEVQYAEFNLGIVLQDQRKFAEASRQFAGALQTIEAVAAVDPKNADYQRSVALSLAWRADAQTAEGKIAEALATRRRQVAFLERLTGAAAGDADYRQKLVSARQRLGYLLATTGDVAAGAEQLRKSVVEAQALIQTDPTNTLWFDYAASSKLALAEVLLGSGDTAGAAEQTQSACALTERLLARDTKVVNWRTLLRDCLVLRTQLALAANDKAAALAISEQAAAVSKSIRSTDPVRDRYEAAKALRLVGDAQKRSGNGAAAQAAWQEALATMPANVAERPGEMSERARVLQRLGRTGEAQQLAARLKSIGYRYGDYIG
jgi:tetratricopeptide (TPR) repeat protein